MQGGKQSAPCEFHRLVLLQVSDVLSNILRNIMFCVVSFTKAKEALLVFSP